TLGYRRFFTVWNFLAVDAPFQARRTFPDNERDPRPLAERYPESLREVMMRYLRTKIESAPVLRTLARQDLETRLPRTATRRPLLVVMPPSPHYVGLLTDDEKLRFARVVTQTVATLEEAEYQAIALGPDLTPDDFADATHLSPAGGIKLADLVVPRIREM